RYLAAGTLSMPPPPVADAFDIDLMHQVGDRYFSPVPPGWPGLLAIGVFLGAPSLVNPLLAGVSVLLTFGVVRRLYDARTACGVALLLAASPWFLFTSMSYMTHTATLAFALLAAWAILRSRETGVALWAGLGGAAIGVVSLIRPLDGVIVAA